MNGINAIVVEREFIEGAKPLQGQPTSSTNDYNVPVERDHAFGWDNVFPAHNNESKASEDHSKPYTDKFGKRHVSWTCPKCGEEFGIAGHSGEGERFEHLMSHESKATEGGSELWAECI